MLAESTFVYIFGGKETKTEGMTRNRISNLTTNIILSNSVVKLISKQSLVAVTCVGRRLQLTCELRKRAAERDD